MSTRKRIAGPRALPLHGLVALIPFFMEGCAIEPQPQSIQAEKAPQDPARLQMGVALLAAFGGQYQPTPGKLMLFGGRDHKTYLGCLNCGPYASDSVSNSYGNFGSAYSPTSIFNPYGEFGSPYSMYSACDPYASEPPVIVDQSGQFYGRLTVNRFNAQQTQNVNLLNWLATACQQ